MKALVLVVTAALLLGACEAGPRPEPAADVGSRLDWGECDEGIAVSMSGRHRCGTLTVPAVRGAAEATLELGVLQVWPPEASASDSVALSVGFNFGEPPQEPGMVALLSERLGVSVVSLSPRGVGDAGGTGLECPETDDASGRDRSTFLTGVQACRDRLTALGVDLSAFGLDDVVGDLEALRAALSVDTWYVLISYGEMARVSDRYAASHPERVRAIVQDSPPAHDRDPLASGEDGTRSALAALFEECRTSRRCASRYPQLERTWERAIDRVAARPIDADGTAVDDAVLLRAVRAMLGGDGPAYVADLPRVIATTAQGRLHPALASVLADDADYCVGYRPLCTRPGFSLGAYLSQVCPELNPDALPRSGDGPYARVFGHSPYLAACERWDVPAASVAARAADVPTLVLTGSLDPWSRPEWFDGAVVVPGATHDVAGSSFCALEIRNPWIADPTAGADPAPCRSAPPPHWD